MNESRPSDEPKIIVDDNWKAQVEAEREQAQQSPTPEAHDAESEFPPASFMILVSTLASQALASLGAIPDPIENKPVIRLDLAKHMIDTLGVLEAKTKGNLTDQEEEMLTGALYQLRMAFLAATSSPEGGQDPGPGASQIELP